MADTNPTCPKCESAMQPGCPVESAGQHYHKVLSGWRDGLPVVKPGLLWGEKLTLPPKTEGWYLIGFRCVKCGFVEHYALTRPDLKRFLVAMGAASQRQEPSGREGTE